MEVDLNYTKIATTRQG